MLKIVLCACLLLFLYPEISHSAEMRIRTVAATRPIAKAQLTVRSLDNVNALPQSFVSNSEGWTSSFKLSPGLYQFTAISTGFMNSVKEALVDDAMKELVMEMRPVSNIDYSVITIPSDEPDDSDANGDNAQQISLRFLSDTFPHAPIAGVRVLLRDSEGREQRWANTDSSGKLVFDLPSKGPLFVSLPMVILPMNGSVYSFVLLDDCTNSESWDFVPPGATCVFVKGSSAKIEIPGVAQVVPRQNVP